jgi:hypothetical protein
LGSWTDAKFNSENFEAKTGVSWEKFVNAKREAFREAQERQVCNFQKGII